MNKRLRKLSRIYSKVVKLKRNRYAVDGGKIIDSNNNVIFQGFTSLAFNYTDALNIKNLVVLTNKKDKLAILNVETGKLMVPFLLDYVDYKEPGLYKNRANAYVGDMLILFNRKGYVVHNKENLIKYVFNKDNK